MKERFYLLLAGALAHFSLFAQQIENREKYDLAKDKVLYAIGYAHLDTEWKWDYPTVISQFIKNTMEDNFRLLEKYPDCVFNFTGSRRYNMMKEFYPEYYKKVKDYIRQGRWFISGSSVDEAEVISLAAGEAGKRIEVRNKLDWQSREASLKTSFPTTVINEKATCGLNTAAIQRSTNNEVKFEVPSRQWFDLTDRSNGYGVSILEDCKYGSDKPGNGTLRLTLMHTPKANSYVYQSTQDWGFHDFIYAIYPHAGDRAYAGSPWQGAFLNAPLVAFETAKHDGPAGKAFSLVTLNTTKVDIMAFKKAEEVDYYIVRVNELYGRNADGVSLGLPGNIVDASEVNGQEQKIGAADFTDGLLHFDMTCFMIRSFAVKLAAPARTAAQTEQKSFDLPFNGDVISTDANRADGEMANGLTFPAELIPAEIVSEDIRFRTGSTADGPKNVVAAGGQTLALPEGEYNRLYILVAAARDTVGQVVVGKQRTELDVQAWTGYIGQHYGRKLTDRDTRVTEITPAFIKRDNIAWYASQCHSAKGNEPYQYSYLYKYKVDIPKGAKSVTLPKNGDIKIFAITVASQVNEEMTPLEPLYDDFRDNPTIQLRETLKSAPSKNK